ncbi:MAG TPA: hypothetical protein PKZ97_13160, partial [Azospirillaceae bacterium]|nr:hypothetical protein [Azospirillaceae bacterium]
MFDTQAKKCQRYIQQIYIEQPHNSALAGYQQNIAHSMVTMLLSLAIPVREAMMDVSSKCSARPRRPSAGGANRSAALSICLRRP